MVVLVTGGAGYIGSHTVVALLQAGYDVIIADDLSNSSETAVDRIEQITGKKVDFRKMNVCDAAAVEELFAHRKDIEAVIHFAGFKAVGESVEKPLEYYGNNIDSALVILNAMKRHQVKNFVFSSSATVYGEPASVPVTEAFPLSATNPYGYTKLMVEQILRDLYTADGRMNIAILRYFNPIGAHESGLIGENPNGIPNNLVPYVAQVAVGKLAAVRVFGDDYPTKDGTGIRDYIHVMDLAEGHIAALQKITQNSGLVTYNLGTGIGYSVLDIIMAFRKASGKEIPYKVVPRRAGDIAETYADPTLAKQELNWQAQYTLEQMCADSWNWQSKNPNGYAGKEAEKQ